MLYEDLVSTTVELSPALSARKGTNAQAIGEA